MQHLTAIHARVTIKAESENAAAATVWLFQLKK
jgi:hypothetical protein